MAQLLGPPPATSPLAAGRSPRRARPPRPRVWIAALVVAGVIAIVGLALVLRAKPAPQIATAAVVRATLDATVTATGTVNPQDTINVGTQVSGTIEQIFADYNDRVRAGQVLARLDPTLLDASLQQARGNLAQAQAQARAAAANAGGASATETAAASTAAAALANVDVASVAVSAADAGVAKAGAALDLARKTLVRDRALLASGYIAQSQYDADASSAVAADSALRSADVAAQQSRSQLTASRRQADAAEAQRRAAFAQSSGSTESAAAARAAIDTAQAAVKLATTNLANSVIRSPVDGTVIARNVSVGQTVAASFQTPTLYTIAKDLAKMQIDLAVGEPDIGSVRAGQDVAFTVLAYPTAIFTGTVAQVRENPTTLQNVVTYDTVVYVKNDDRRLRPGMTANATIRVAHADDALVVPLAALSYRAPAKPLPARASSPPSASTAWGNTGTADIPPIAPGNGGLVTLVENGRLRSVPVRIVLVNAGQVAIAPLDPALKEGSLVAIGAAANAQPSTAPGRTSGLLH